MTHPADQRRAELVEPSHLRTRAMTPKQAMTREEMDAFIAGYEKIALIQPAWTDLVVRVPAESLQNLLRLARLGASVAAPRDDEIEAMILAWFEGAPATNNPEFAPRMRAALSALRESKP